MATPRSIVARGAVLLLFLLAGLVLLVRGSHRDRADGSSRSAPLEQNMVHSGSSPRPGTVEESELICRITVVDTMYGSVNESHDMSVDEQVVCLPMIDGVERPDTFDIELPDDVVMNSREAIARGVLMVRLQGAYLSSSEVVLAEGSSCDVLPTTGAPPTERHLGATEILSLAVIRVSTFDSEPSYSVAEIEEILFSSDKVNIRTQLAGCSFQQLQITNAGVFDVQIQRTGMTDARELREAAERQAAQQMGVSSISDFATKVFFILPPGTGDWLASAAMNHWRAQFNDMWGLSLGATMHEMGHLMGLPHANKPSAKYADWTGYMGDGELHQHYPKKCFNGMNSWRLDWYASRSLEIDPFAGPQKITLSAFAHFDRALPDEPVVVKAGDVYLQYNLADGPNVETEMLPNTVTVTQAGEGGSNLLGGLQPGQSYEIEDYQSSGRSLVLAACTQSNTDGVSASTMVMSVALDESWCDRALTSVPTLRPTQSPSHQPTNNPTHTPTQAPTHTPTEIPTYPPTLTPSITPTYPPSVTPSVAPSLSDQPSSVPTLTPSMKNESLVHSDAPSSIPTVWAAV